MEISKKIRNTSQHTKNLSGGKTEQNSVRLLEKARTDTDAVLKELGSSV